MLFVNPMIAYSKYEQNTQNIVACTVLTLQGCGQPSEDDM